MKPKVKTTLRRFAFAEAPTVGTALSINDQRYDLVGFVPYQRDNWVGTLAQWATRCRTCDAPFECTTAVSRFPEVRNCVDHRAKTFAEKREEAGR